MRTKTTIQAIRRFCAAAGASLLSLALFLAPAWAAAPALKEITVAYQPYASPSGALLEVIKRDRTLHNALVHNGLRLKIRLIHKGSDAIGGLRQKTVDVTTMGEMPLLETAASIPVVIIGQHKQNFASVITQRGTTAQDLKGKRIGNAFATSGHYVLLKTLKNAGLDERDITLVQMDVTEMPTALLTGKIDAFAAWEPTPSSFVARHPDRFSSIGRQSNSAYLLLERSTTVRHPELAGLVAASMARAINWISKSRANLKQAATWNRESMQQLSGKVPTVSVEELSQQIFTDLQHINRTARLPAQIARPDSPLAEVFDFLKTTGKLPQTAQWEQIRGMFNPEVMERVYRSPASSGINRFDYAH